VRDPRQAPIEQQAPDLQDILDLYTTSERAIFEAERSAQIGWRASGIGYCPRRQYLHRAGVPPLKPDMEAAQRRTLAWGDSIHYFMKNITRRAGLFIAEEVKMKDEVLDITGTCDLLWGGELQPYVKRDNPNHWDDFLEAFRRSIYESYGEQVPVILTELKSAKTYAIEKAQEHGAKEVNGAYHEQLATYFILASMHPDQLPVEPDVFRLTLIGKETADVVSFGLQQSAIDRVWWKLEELAKAWNGQAQPQCTCWQDGPPRKKKPFPWTVEYCDYFDGEKDCCHAMLLEAAELTRSGVEPMPPAPKLEVVR
jgi:hypothetical protein